MNKAKHTHIPNRRFKIFVDPAVGHWNMLGINRNMLLKAWKKTPVSLFNSSTKKKASIRSFSWSSIIDYPIKFIIQLNQGLLTNLLISSGVLSKKRQYIICFFTFLILAIN